MCMPGLPKPQAAPAALITPPPPPTAVDPAVLAARANIMNNAAREQGRGSTIATSAAGDPSGTSGKKALLGL